MSLATAKFQMKRMSKKDFRDNNKDIIIPKSVFKQKIIVTLYLVENNVTFFCTKKNQSNKNKKNILIKILKDFLMIHN